MKCEREPLAHAIVGHRQHIRPPHAENQQHFHRPRPNPAHRRQPLDNLRVRHLPDRRVGGHCPVQGAGRQVLQRLALVSGDPRRPQHLIRRIQQQLRRRIAAKIRAHPAMDRSRGLAVQLLVEDRLEQRLERRGSRIQPQRERARPVDQRAQLGVARVQVRHGLGGIEGKFAASAIVDHRRTVYRAGTVSRRRPPEPAENLPPRTAP